MKTFWYYILVCISVLSCKTHSTDLMDFNQNPSMSCNQQIVNGLTDPFRVDTTCFIHLKQPSPPTEGKIINDYSVYAKVANNDLALTWGFIEKAVIQTKVNIKPLMTNKKLIIRYKKGLFQFETALLKFCV